MGALVSGAAFVGRTQAWVMLAASLCLACGVSALATLAFTASARDGVRQPPGPVAGLAGLAGLCCLACCLVACGAANVWLASTSTGYAAFGGVVTALDAVH